MSNYSYLYVDGAVFVVRVLTDTAYLPGQGNRARFTETVFHTREEAEAFLAKIRAK